jgi:hypothetical protein
MKEGVPFASIEQNRIYARRIKRGLRHSFLDDRYVHHVPVVGDGWYRQRDLDRLVSLPCECLFVDGPVGSQDALGSGERDGPRARAWLAAAAATAKLLIVDDVQRPANRLLLSSLVAGARISRLATSPTSRTAALPTSSRWRPPRKLREPSRVSAPRPASS